MDPPAAAAVTQPEIVNNIILPVTLPVANIKTEIGVDGERGNSSNIAVDDSEEVTPSPTTGDEQPLNPWLSVKCIFCEIKLSPTEEPKLLECLHAACGNCITAKINEHISGNLEVNGESNGVVCPLCHVICRGTNIIENHFLVESQAATVSEIDANDSSKVTELKCGSCPDTAATSWCVECAEFICDGCVQAHQRLKITKEHTIKPKEEGEPDNHAPAAGAQHKSLFCSVHHQERLSLFCETCDRLTCRDCQLSDHRDHKYKFINEIAAETRNMISGLLSEVSYKRVLLKSAMKVIDDRQNLIIEKKKQLVKEITQMVVKLTNTINARGKQLVVRLNEVCDGKQKTLNEKKLALEQLSALTDHCIDFVNMALSRGSDMALLFSKTNLTTHLQRIKSRRADIPNPEIPVRINLALDKVPDLIKVASTIGSIIVDGRMYPPPNNYTNGSSSNGSASAPPAPPSNQAGAQRHYTSSPQHSAPPPYHNRVSPLQGMAQMPNHLGQRNMNMHRSAQPPHHQQVVIKTQPSGTVQHHAHQQVTSSTHPYNNSHHEANLRGLLAHHSYHQNGYSTHGIRATSPQAAIAGPSMPLYRMAGSNQLPPPLPPHTANQRYIHGQHNYNQQQVANHQSSRQHAAYSPAARQLVQRVQSPHSSNQQAGPTASGAIQWHIPQQPAAGQYPGSPSPALGHKPTPPHHSAQDDSYKITLKQPMGRQHSVGTPPALVDQKPILPHPPFVSSSVPKTPSPHTQAKAADDAEKSLDKFCQNEPKKSLLTLNGHSFPVPSHSFPSQIVGPKEKKEPKKSLLVLNGHSFPVPLLSLPSQVLTPESVNDLMMTIAKLDSNGILVIPEKGADSLVDSSTGPPIDRPSTSTAGASQTTPSSQGSLDSQKDDPNEDWCAVCLDGGEPVLCCDNCPKVFHLKCHIPSLSAFPGESETWQCLLCTGMSNVTSNIQIGEKRPHTDGLDSHEQTLMQRILLELYCQYEPSLHFREVIPADNLEYHEKIKRPMSFDMIRQKLTSTSSDRYRDMKEVVDDIRLVFKNAYTFNPKESQVYSDAKSLEEFLDMLLEKWVPALAYDDTDLEPSMPKRMRRSQHE